MLRAGAKGHTEPRGRWTRGAVIFAWVTVGRVGWDGVRARATLLLRASPSPSIRRTRQYLPQAMLKGISRADAVTQEARKPSFPHRATGMHPGMPALRLQPKHVGCVLPVTLMFKLPLSTFYTQQMLMRIWSAALAEAVYPPACRALHRPQGVSLLSPTCRILPCRTASPSACSCSSSGTVLSYEYDGSYSLSPNIGTYLHVGHGATEFAALHLQNSGCSTGSATLLSSDQLQVPRPTPQYQRYITTHRLPTQPGTQSPARRPASASVIYLTHVPTLVLPPSSSSHLLCGPARCGHTAPFQMRSTGTVISTIDLHSDTGLPHPVVVSPCLLTCLLVTVTGSYCLINAPHQQHNPPVECHRQHATPTRSPRPAPRTQRRPFLSGQCVRHTCMVAISYGP